MSNPQRGFTLMELVVATAIFFIMAAMLYSALDAVRQQLVFSEQAESSTRELHYAMRRIALDLAQIQPRAVRDELGDQGSAVRTNTGTAAVEISVGGWRNPMALPRGSIQRVAYVVDGDTLARLHWPVLDRTLASEPLRIELLEGVLAIQVRFLDASGEWTEQWPPLDASGSGSPRQRPRAIEIVLEHEEWGVINRLIEVAG